VGLPASGVRDDVSRGRVGIPVRRPIAIQAGVESGEKGRLEEEIHRERDGQASADLADAVFRHLNSEFYHHLSRSRSPFAGGARSENVHVVGGLGGQFGVSRVLVQGQIIERRRPLDR